MRRVFLVLATLSALLITMAQPVAAAPPMRESGTYTFASATTSECTQQGSGTVCTDTNIFVQETEDFSVVCVDVTKYSISSSGRYRFISSEGGCTELAPGAFTVSGDLQSATLAPTEVVLSSCNRRGCTEGDTITVSATFTGTGEIRTYSGRGSFTENGCRYRYSFQGESRDATVTVTVDGDSSSGYGTIQSEDYTFTSTC